MAYHYHNCPSEPKISPSPLPNPILLAAPPGSDIWRKPPLHDAFDAPICYRTLPLSIFNRARVTVSAQWKTQYDQGGLCLIIPSPTSATGMDLPPRQKWIKTGIELYNGAPYVSTVACDRWADWGLWPLQGESVTIEMEREVREGGTPTSTLWVYIVNGQIRTPVREITWVFEGVEQEEPRDCWVGVYAAKPKRDDDGDGPLKVLFDGFKVETF